MSQGGTDTHQMMSWKGTETKVKSGDRITLELQTLRKKIHMHLEKLEADADVILEPQAAVSRLDLMASVSQIQKHFHYGMH